jgi:hypothetical protein
MDFPEADRSAGPPVRDNRYVFYRLHIAPECYKQYIVLAVYSRQFNIGHKPYSIQREV